MDPKPIIGAVLGAVLGAAIWGSISYFIGYEVGYVAWGIGGLVGGGAYVMGGGGQSVGAMCALLAVGAIFCGKMLAIQMVIMGETNTFIKEGTTREEYDSQIKEATQFSILETDSDYRKFMVDYDFVDAARPDDVTRAELDDFYLYNAPLLMEFFENEPTYNEWRNEMGDLIRSIIRESTSVTDIVVDNLSWMDFVFAFLGIATAFRLGSQDELRGT